MTRSALFAGHILSPASVSFGTSRPIGLYLLSILRRRKEEADTEVPSWEAGKAASSWLLSQVPVAKQRVM